jgi:hypothetical protein
MARNATIRSRLICAMPERARDEATADTVRLVEAAWPTQQIGVRFAIEDIAEAHRAQESAAIMGNTVVAVAGAHVPASV